MYTEYCLVDNQANIFINRVMSEPEYLSYVVATEIGQCFVG